MTLVWIVVLTIVIVAIIKVVFFKVIVGKKGVFYWKDHVALITGGNNIAHL